MEHPAYMHLEPLFAEALESSEPFEALRSLAQSWAVQGMPQAEMYAAFEQQLQRQSHAEGERRYDALVNTMDLIVGWCAPGTALYKPVSKPNASS